VILQGRRDAFPFAAREQTILRTLIGFLPDGRILLAAREQILRDAKLEAPLKGYLPSEALCF